MVTLGERLHDWREARGWTTHRLAQESGVDAAYVYRLETGRAPRPGHQTLTSLAGALQVPVSALTGAPDDPDPVVQASWTAAYRLGPLLDAISGCDPGELLRTLGELSPARQADAARLVGLLRLEEEAAARAPRPDGTPPSPRLGRALRAPRILPDPDADA